MNRTVRISTQAAELDAIVQGRHVTHDGTRGFSVPRHTSRYTWLEGPEDALVAQANAFFDLSGASWDRPASEKACTRRAARSIYQQLGVRLPFHMQPRRRW